MDLPRSRSPIATAGAEREREHHDRDEQRGGARATLEVWKEGCLIEEHELTPGVFTVGRAEGNHICTEHVSCSRAHAELRVKSDGVVELVDVGSAAGTFVDASEIRPQHPHVLNDLAKISFGSSTRCYLLRLPVAPVATASCTNAQFSAAAARPAGATAQERRKLLWGGKRGARGGGASSAQPRAVESNAAGWATAASALGDSERQSKFLSLLGANKHAVAGSGGTSTAGTNIVPSGSAPPSHSGQGAQPGHAQQRQQQLFRDLESQFERSRGGRGGRFGQ